MKISYNEILEDYMAYESSIRELDNEFMSIATEASAQDMLNGSTVNGQTQNNNNDAGNETTDQQNEATPEQRKKFTDMIKRFIDKLVEMINRAKIAINNIIKKGWVTDKGFWKNYNMMKKTTKPIEGYEAIVYQYKDNYLKNTVGGFLRDVSQRAAKIFDNEANDDPDADTILREAMAKYSNQQPQNTSEFINTMIAEFRGEKKTIQFNKSMIGELENTVREGNGPNAYEGYLKDTDAQISRIKARQQTLRQNASTEQIKAMARKCSIVTNLYNSMLSVERTYYSLRTERYLAARTCLQKFYS